jgi:AcrR family transcriptional regulator
VTAPPDLQPLSPRAADVVAAARLLLEREGAEPFTMRRLADELKIQAPSIYKHLPGKHAIEVALIELGLAEIGAACHAAVAQPGPAGVIPSLLATYRRYSLAHPNLYRLATAGELYRADLTPGLEEWAGQPWWLATGDPYLAQALWSFAHGMVILELDRRYPDDSELDRTWAAGAAAFAAAAAKERRGGVLSLKNPRMGG